MENREDLEPISRFVDGELAGSERLDAAERIYTEPAARDSWIAFERGKAALSLTARAMPERLHKRLAAMSEAAARPGFFEILSGPRTAWAFAAAAVLFAFASQLEPRPQKSVPLARLLAEHAQATRKSSDIGRAIVHASPYLPPSGAEAGR